MLAAFRLSRSARPSLLLFLVVVCFGPISVARANAQEPRSAGMSPSPQPTRSVDVLWRTSFAPNVLGDSDEVDGHVERANAPAMMIAPLKRVGSWGTDFDGHLVTNNRGNRQQPTTNGGGKGKVTKIIVGLGMIGAGSYLMASSRGYTTVRTVPDRNQIGGFRYEPECVAVKPVYTDPRAEPPQSGSRCYDGMRLWPGFGLLFGGIFTTAWGLR